MFNLGYIKTNNDQLFKDLATVVNIDDAQNYCPLYDVFFGLNEKTANSINLNHRNQLTRITDKINETIYTVDICDTDKTQPSHSGKSHKKNVRTTTAFIKFCGLVDYVKYLCGKYHDAYDSRGRIVRSKQNIEILPKFGDRIVVDGHLTTDDIKNAPSSNCVSSMRVPYNVAYIDGFFSFLTSTLLNSHGFIHGTDFYGSFIGIKKNFEVNVYDDFSYMREYNFFMTNKDVLYKIDDKIADAYIGYNSKSDSQQRKTALRISDVCDEDLEIDVNIVSETTEHNCLELQLDTDAKNETENTDNADINFKCDNSDVSSRSSYTTDSEDGEDDIGDGEDTDISHIITDEEAVIGDLETLTIEPKTSDEDGSYKSYSSDDDDADSYSTDDANIRLVIDRFPVNMVALEALDDTLDSLMYGEYSDCGGDTEDDATISGSEYSGDRTECSIDTLSDEEWASAFFQIIMILATYQKVFHFTHNDLHSNNIMFNATDKQFLTYKYNGQYWKVPTFGRIFKIIDFGRSIYTYRGVQVVSYSFSNEGDAYSQYNMEPYYDPSKPKVLPNYSFDLCRLGCSIYDYFINDDTTSEELSSPIVKLVREWCMDDKGRNVLYKANGAERYENFKLYKMIARTVHNHTPDAQLTKPIFQQYKVGKKQAKHYMDIDALPEYHMP